MPSDVPAPATGIPPIQPGVEQLQDDDAEMARAVYEADALLIKLMEMEEKGETPDWEQLRGRPGVALEPMTWERCAGLIEEKSLIALAQLGRTPAQLKRYKKFRNEHILAKFKSVTDYLYVQVFDLQSRPSSSDDEKLEAVVPEDFRSTKRVVWRQNDFPYALQEGISHDVLWSSVPLSDAEVLAAAQRERQGCEFTIFVNPELFKSVPAIWHAHIVSREVA